MVKLVGIQLVRFTAKETGELVEGYNFYFNETDENVTGYVAYKAFLSQNSAKRFLDESGKGFSDLIGSTVYIERNRFGRIQEIRLAPKVGK